MSKTFSYRQKVVILGDSGVGKTCLVNRLVFNMYINYTNPTIGAAFASYRANDDFIYEIWDTAGQERFHSLLPMYLRNANIIFIIIDISHNLEQINKQFIKWFSYTKKNISLLNKDYKICLFFNKQDTNKYFQVPEDILKNEEISFINLISAKTGYNIDRIKFTLDSLAKIHMNEVHPNTQNNNRINYNLDLVVNTIKSKCML